MRQRAMIAMALALNPKVLIADEPTTALDVTVQAQIIDLMRRLQAEFGTAIILITHDLGLVAEIAEDVLVMYAGRAMERADRRTLFYRPHHPYTRGLLASLPAKGATGERLTPISGLPPSLIRLPGGCPFHPRCARCCRAAERRYRRCGSSPPVTSSACWLPEIGTEVPRERPPRREGRACCCGPRASSSTSRSGGGGSAAAVAPSSRRSTA